MPSLPFPKPSGIAIEGLKKMDIVAIVRPVGQPADAKRGGDYWTTQTFEVLSSRSSLRSSTLRVSLPTGSYGRQLDGARRRQGGASVYSAPGSHTYLLFAMKPSAGRLGPIYTGRGGQDREVPQDVAEDRSISATKDEVLGVALVQTDLSQLPSAPTNEGAILRALALSTALPGTSPYGPLPLWNSILPFTVATWDGEALEKKAERDVIEGLPAMEFYRQIVSPLLRGSAKKGDAGTVDLWALRTRWGVTGAAKELSQALLSLVEEGHESEVRSEDSPLRDLGNAGYRDRVGLPQSAMLALASKVKSPFLRGFALDYILKAPTTQEQAYLRPLLDDIAVRKRLMSKLSNWNNRPELAPPSKEREYTAREIELVTAWKVWFDAISK